MLKPSAVSMLTCVALLSACGGSNNDARTANEVSAEGSIQTTEPGTEALAPTPITADPNSTQVTFDSALVQGCGIKEAKIYFPYDSAQVQGNADDRVRAMADCLVSGNLKGKELLLIGHTDPRGSTEYNQELGKSRADSIAQLLISAGMPKEKLVVKSAGENTASAEQDEWPWDRRVEVALVSE
jgi:outer membrane protein OmpA-like peptidoglycan-associated protein